MENRPPYPIDSVDNALQLLLILRRDGLVRVSSAADELGVARSTAHRLLDMLKYRGFVIQDPGRRYLPGRAFRDLGSGVPPIELPVLARPHMQRLAEAVGETVNLMVRSGATVRFVESVEGSAVLRVGSRIGVTLPAHRTSGGKALLAELSRADVEVLYAAQSTSPADMAVIQKQRTATRRCGYGLNLEETEAGVVAVAVCVRDASADAVAALSVAGPTVRYRRAQIIDLLPQLRATADSIRWELLGG